MNTNRKRPHTFTIDDDNDEEGTKNGTSSSERAMEERASSISQTDLKELKITAYEVNMGQCRQFLGNHRKTQNYSIG
jgi:hypothetical protein